MQQKNAACVKIALVSLAALSAGGWAHIRLAVDPFSGKVVLNPKKGDIITWGTDTRFKANFQLVSPCSPCKEGMNANPCTIKVTKGRYLYKCPNCQDPEVVVGSDAGQVPIGKDTAKVTISDQVGMACQGGTIAVSPDPARGAAGQGVYWIAVGDSTPWSVSFADQICMAAVSDTQPVCTVKNGMTGSHAYTVTSPNCAGPGRGTVTVQ